MISKCPNCDALCPSEYRVVENGATASMQLFCRDCNLPIPSTGDCSGQSFGHFASTVAEQLHTVLDRAEYYFRIYIQGNSRFKDYSPDRVSLDADRRAVVFEIEYNDSCHCHPEFRTQEFLIGFDDLNLSVEQYKIVLEERRAAILASQKEQARLEKEIKKLQKEESDRLAAIKKEKEEREQLAILQAKYQK